MKFILPSLALFAMLLLSCSKDNTSDNTDVDEVVVGTWKLTELNITPPQDIDGDGSTTDNILTELDCVSGTLVVNADNSWNLSLNGVNITMITGGLFNISCTSNTNSTSGVWQFQNSRLTLFQGTTSTFYSLNGDKLINTIGEDLPEIRSEVYERQ